MNVPVFMRRFSVLLASFALAACGGSSSSDGEALLTVDSNAGAGGAIIPETRSVSAGTTTTFGLAPDNGFWIEKISGCDGTLSRNTYTVGPVDADCTISVTFTQDQCAVPVQNQRQFAVMEDFYLWYDELPQVNATQFSSQEALLDALRFRPLDRFSFINPAADEQAFFGFGEFVGFGFRSATVDNVQVASDVFEGSPAAGAGLVRGSVILAVDGVPIAEVIASPGGFSGALGPAELGVQVTLEFRNPDGTEFIELLTKDVVAIPPVTAARVIQLDGVPTGYLVFRNFVEPGVPALNAAFADFRAAGVTQLIVDVRYNGGGLVSVLEHFADLLGSRIAPSAAFASYVYNDKNQNRNSTFFFAPQAPAGALDLDKVVFITTGSTASASEMLVNGMPPYVTTAVVGRATFGKPVGQLGFRICENILRPVSFATVNALGEGDYFDGIPVDCAAEDTIEVAFGEAGEDSFDAATHWLQFGFCPQPSGSAKPRLEALEATEREQPHWQLNDAH